jgi:CD63 antigen
MELTAAVLAYMMHGQVSYMLIRTMNDAFMDYKTNTYVASGIDFLQINVS